ncbi:hypothetical protein ColKHC_07432 [Colletotrichum higginsianum]|nr:hypothetical protein ColKHC_07432 [Colletotrichum higginsianum]
MRARAGQSQGSSGGLWNLIVLSNWTSVTVTLTAAVIRVCLALQMGVLTGMIASLLIEKSGVPMGSAPFVSILRAVSASPYHLVSRAALTTPFAIAVGLGVLLTGASQFTSTALLFDFDLANITTPKQTVVLPYGSSQPENPRVDGLDSPVGTSSTRRESWGKYLLTNEIPENGNHLAKRSAEKLNWTSSEEGIWVHLRPPPGSINASVSISTCFTNLPGLFQHVEMSSDQDGAEPGLSWDRVNARYETAPIRGQYENLGDNATVRDSRGILTLHPKTSWGFEEDESNMTKTTKSRSWMPFSSVADGLPYMSLNGDQRAGGILVPGAFSPYAVHYAHAALFQDIVMTTGSLAQGLQGLFTVLRQMAYYEISPYFDMQSPASLILSNEELIPVRWTGFTVVVGMVFTHLILLAVVLVLFFKFTRLSWLGNVWMSLSQVVSLETEDLIDKSTDKLDKEVDKVIKEEASRAGTGSTDRVRIKRNNLRGRSEVSYWQA